MTNKRFKILLLFFLPLLIQAQGIDSFIWRNWSAVEKIPVMLSDTCITLEHPFILPGSQRVFFNSVNPNDVDILFDFNKGTVCLQSDLNRIDTMSVYYSYYPLDLPMLWQRNKVVTFTDTATSEIIRKVVSTEELKSEQYFNALEKNGSISRGFTVGSNQSLSLQSGLNFQISGNISENVNIEASLTDENTPIQPEGNTQNLSEIDRVFIKVNSPYVSGVLGDFYIQQRQFLLNPIDRNLQGIDIKANINNHNILGTFATAEGQFNSISITGQEGNQGPYILKGKRGETNIVVLAGTEKVFINGHPMRRGENYDYIIDYSLGEVKFTTIRPIRGNDRIVIDYEYTSFNRQFGKNYFRAGYSFLGEKEWDVAIGWFREADDFDKPLFGNAGLSEEEKEIISEAGDDQLQAIVSGAVFVGDGNGNYRDSLDLMSGDTIYVYAGRGMGRYSVSFTDVGRGKGDYNRETIGIYNWVGKANGQFLPIRLLPLPQQYDMVALKARADFSGFNTDMEVNVSRFDENVFSDKENDNDLGISSLLNWAYKNTELGFLGKFNINQYWRFNSKFFRALDRLERPDYESRWGLSQVFDQTNTEELVNETTLEIIPNERFSFQLNGGFRNNEGQYRSLRAGERIAWTIVDSLDMKHEFEIAQSDYDINNSSSTFIDGFLELEQSWSRVNLKLSGKAGSREEFFALHPNRGWHDYELNTGVDWLLTDSKLFAEFGTQIENAIFEEEWQDLANSWQMRIGGELNSANGQGQMSWFHRDKKVNETFQQMTPEEKNLYLNPQYIDTTLTSQKSDLVKIWWRQKIKSINADIRLDYEVGSEQNPILDKFYLDVGLNNGNFRFDSTLSQWVPDNNGTHLLILTPTGNFQPVTNVKTGLGLIWLGRGIYSPLERNRSGWKKFVDQLKLNINWQVEERSTSDDLLALYLLLPSAIQSDSTVQGNISYRQDLFWYYTAKRDFFNIRYQYLSSLFRQFVSSEDNDKQESQRFDIFHHLTLSTAFINDLDLSYRNSRKLSSSASIKDENISGLSFDDKLTWKFFQNWNQSLSLELSYEKNDVIDNYIELFYNQFLWQLTIPWASKGRIGVNFRRISVDILEAGTDYAIPYSMAKGKKEGVSFDWSFQFGYSVNRHININVNYTGRKDATFENILHTGQAEIKAFF